MHGKRDMKKQKIIGTLSRQYKTFLEKRKGEGCLHFEKKELKNEKKNTMEPLRIESNILEKGKGGDLLLLKIENNEKD